MARCFAVAMSQAPGLSGMPVRGHCSSAITSASCASSSARPTSRTSRARPAMSLADSIRQTASMARWVSVAVMAKDDTIGTGTAQAKGDQVSRGCGGWRAAARSVLGGDVLAHARFLRPQLRCRVVAEILGLEHTPDLDFLVAPGKRRAPDPLHRLGERLHLPQPEAGDEFLGFGERPVAHDALAAAAEFYAHAALAGVQPLGRQQYAGLHQLLVEAAHFGEDLFAGQHATFGIFIGLNDHHDSHMRLLPAGSLRCPMSLRRMSHPGIDTRGLFWPGTASFARPQGCLRLVDRALALTVVQRAPRG